MESQTWKTTLTIKTDNESFRDVREWLQEHDSSGPPPARNDDALAKYLRLVLQSNNDWDAVSLGIGLPRPRPVYLPWQTGYESEPPTAGTVRAGLAAARRRQFAVDCCALLVLLIVGATGFAAHQLRNSHQAVLPLSYNANERQVPVHQFNLALGGRIP